MGHLGPSRCSHRSPSQPLRLVNNEALEDERAIPAAAFRHRAVKFLGAHNITQGHTFAAGAMFSLAHDFRVMRADRGYWCLPEADAIAHPRTPDGAPGRERAGRASALE